MRERLLTAFNLLTAMAFAVAMVSTMPPAAHAQNVELDPGAPCAACHIDQPTGPHQCGYWPGSPACQDVTITLCGQATPYGVGGSLCSTTIYHYYWS